MPEDAGGTALLAIQPDRGWVEIPVETADQAEAFRHWTKTCGIDWTIEPRAQPLPLPTAPPEWPSSLSERGTGRPVTRPR